MKKLKIILAALFLSAMFSTQANAQDIYYQGDVDLGYSIGVGDFGLGRINIGTSHGARLGDYFYAGIGLGVDIYHESGEVMIPVGVNLKGYLPLDFMEPFLYTDLGYGIYTQEGLNGGLNFGIGLGTQFNWFKVQLGYSLQQISQYGISVNFNAIQIKLGFVF